MKHFTKNTISATKWCGKCVAQTPHRVDNGRIGPCLNCIDRQEEEHRRQAARKKPAQQTSLFGGQR